jgi:rhomboid family GlyGly-CTERM serine protease
LAAIRVTNSPNVAKQGRNLAMGWWLIGLALGAMVLLWALGDKPELALRYDRQQILEGQYWRLITGHWVHDGLRHMALNVLGALVIAFLFLRTYTVIQWVAVLGMSTIAIDVGFLWLEPQLEWYVGASGVLHGALVAGAIAWWRTESRFMALALSAIVCGKLAWEQSHGALPLAGEMPVIVDAHLYGAIGGLLASICIELTRRYSRSKGTPAPL